MADLFAKGLTCMLILSIFSAVLGMVQFGYNTGVMNVPQDIFKEFISNSYRNQTKTYLTEDALYLFWSVTVSIFAIGGMLGGLSGGMVADLCGRKCGLLLNNAFAIFGATLLSSSKMLDRFECLILGRFFLGLNCGLNTALVPMYLSEIAPTNLRGALGTVSQLGVTVGLLLSQILGFPSILGTNENWPFLLSIAFVPAVLQLLLLPLCPESPRYLLLTKSREHDAKKALQRFRCMNDVSADLEEMRIERERNSEKKLTILQLMGTLSLRKPLMIAVVMQLSQQLSGINAIFYYSTEVFKTAGLDNNQAKYATSAVGGCMVFMTLVSIPLMDRAGRKTLHLTGLGGMFLTSIFLTISLLVKFIYHGMAFVSVISVLSFTIFFAVGPGSIPWLITAELFSQGSRGAAISIAVLVNWLTNFIVGLVFPLMVRAIDSYSFLPFTTFIAIFWTFTYHKVPETKNRSFDEISAMFAQQSSNPNDLLEPQEPTMAIHQSQLAPIMGQPKAMSIEQLDQLQKETLPFNTKPVDPCLHHFHPHLNFHCHFEPQFPTNMGQIPIQKTGVLNAKPKKKRSVAELDGESLLLNHMLEDQL